MAAHSSNHNIILTGFMGTGKTTVGRLLADRLSRRFVDMDVLLAEQFGKSIAAVFADDGEEAFREAEASLCAQLAREQDLVVSTGGGALVDARNRETFAASGTIVCLTAHEDEILLRLQAADDRPLLAGERETRQRKMRALLRERRTAYGAISHQIDTTGLTPHEVADRVQDAVAADCEAPGMIRIPVRSPEGTYDLCLGDGLLAHAGQLLVNRGLRPGRTAIVTNDMLLPHAETLLASLRARRLCAHNLHRARR